MRLSASRHAQPQLKRKLAEAEAAAKYAAAMKVPVHAAHSRLILFQRCAHRQIKTLMVAAMMQQLRVTLLLLLQQPQKLQQPSLLQTKLLKRQLLSPNSLRRTCLHHHLHLHS